MQWADAWGPMVPGMLFYNPPEPARGNGVPPPPVPITQQGLRQAQNTLFHIWVFLVLPLEGWRKTGRFSLGSSSPPNEGVQGSPSFRGPHIAQSSATRSGDDSENVLPVLAELCVIQGD